jgi:hypothetical protein
LAISENLGVGFRILVDDLVDLSLVHVFESIEVG